MRRFAKVSASLALALAGGLSTTLLAAPAAACSPLKCKPGGYVAPREGTTIPRNAAAIFYAPTRALADVGAGLSLTTDDGGTIIPLARVPAASPKDGLYGGVFTLGAPLDPGKVYEVRHYQSCTPEHVTSADFWQHTFSVGAAAPLPESPGSLTIAATQREKAYSVPDNHGGCVAPIDASVVRLAFTPSPDLVPWLALTTFQVFIDGQPVIRTAAGVDPNIEIPSSFYARSPLQLHARCAGSDTTGGWDTIGTTLGAHQVRLEAAIAGIEAPVSTETTVTFACESASAPGTPGAGGAAGAGGGPGESGGAGAGAGGGTAGATSVGGSTGALATSEANDDPSCRAASGAPPRLRALGSLSALGLLATLRLRRRRR